MEIKEELKKEYAEWTKKYMKAHDQIGSLLPIQTGEEIPRLVLTKELLGKFDKASKDEATALAKLRDIQEKLYQLR
ncbi:MAG: hypothetical protein HYX84_01700 [Chloroflexi bacterium]|nr:hypothetical protein [Chloroflexota bacterium]